jgi:hypothetical protein
MPSKVFISYRRDAAKWQAREQLPDDLLRPIRRNAEFVEHRHVDTDVERLIRRD